MFTYIPCLHLDSNQYTAWWPFLRSLYTVQYGDNCIHVLYATIYKPWSRQYYTQGHYRMRRRKLHYKYRYSILAINLLLPLCKNWPSVLSTYGKHFVTNSQLLHTSLCLSFSRYCMHLTETSQLLKWKLNFSLIQSWFLIKPKIYPS